MIIRPYETPWDSLCPSFLLPFTFYLFTSPAALGDGTDAELAREVVVDAGTESGYGMVTAVDAAGTGDLRPW